MYIPEYYLQENSEEIISFMKEFSFATLISSNNDAPFVTHLPFLIEKTEKGLKLITHLAKANPHSAVLENKEAIIVFSGPHAYISATWYVNTRNVPTWNYTSVHVKGTTKLITEPNLLAELLDKTVSNYENGKTEHHQQLPSEYKVAMAKEVIGVEINVTSIEAKFKLSQNKPKEDILAVINHLETNSENKRLIELMKTENKKKLQ